VPATIGPVTGAAAGRALRCHRARRTRSAAAADGVSFRVLDASLRWRMIAGSRRLPTTWTTGRSERREFARTGDRACCRPRTSARVSSKPAASETSSIAPATTHVASDSSLDLRSCSSSMASVRASSAEATASAREAAACRSIRLGGAHGSVAWKAELRGERRGLQIWAGLTVSADGGPGASMARPAVTKRSRPRCVRLLGRVHRAGSRGRRGSVARRARERGWCWRTAFHDAAGRADESRLGDGAVRAFLVDARGHGPTSSP
jgi:hypothetical protein